MGAVIGRFAPVKGRLAELEEVADLERAELDYPVDIAIEAETANADPA